MKILRVAADLYPYVVGGVGIHVHEMSKLQSSLGHEVCVYTAKTESASSGIDTNYEVRRYNILIKLLGNSIMPGIFYDLWKNRRKYDIIHAHSHLYFSTNLCALLRKAGSSPLVITSHGLNSQTAPRWFQNLYTATGARMTFYSADRIICYTEVEKQELVNSLGIKEEKICVIHNGINTDLFTPSRIPPSGKQLLWIGRYAKGKGVEYLIDAMKTVVAQYPDIILHMVGVGPDREKNVQMIHESGLDKNIVFRDFIPNSEIVTLYNKSSVFILPSLEEGVPRTVLEAMSCAVPVVCSNLPQLTDIVKGSGFLVPVKNSRELADRILQLLSDPELAMQMGNNGRQRVLNDFSWQDTVKKTLLLYEELV